MLARRPFALFFSGVVALGLVPAATAAEPLRCEGVFGPDSSEARLIESYGRDNVVSGEVDGPEGTTMLATTVFPDDAGRSIQFTWWDEEALSLPANILLPPGSTGPGGVAAGMSVAEVQALNGEPFEMTGFFWDYGGYAGFQSGRLAEIEGGCMLSLSFTPQREELSQAQSDRVSGDQMLSSELTDLAELDTRVTAVNFGYPAPEGWFDDMDGGGDDETAEPDAGE